MPNSTENSGMIPNVSLSHEGIYYGAVIGDHGDVRKHCIVNVSVHGKVVVKKNAYVTHEMFLSSKHGNKLFTYFLNLCFKLKVREG